MRKRILWFDNDPGIVDAYITGLRNSGYEVVVVTTVTEADRVIQQEEFDLLILDAMIPTKNEEEEKIYKPLETDTGHETGLVFYRRFKQRLADTKTPTLVMTVRLDSAIAKKFAEEGLPTKCFKRRLEFRDGPLFLKTVRELLKNSPLITQTNQGGQ
jgi:CheY-like chemotaxis protein